MATHRVETPPCAVEITLNNLPISCRSSVPRAASLPTEPELQQVSVGPNGHEKSIPRSNGQGQDKSHTSASSRKSSAAEGS